MNGPITRDGLRVCRDLCSTCIFRPGNPMTLRPGRVKAMVAEASAADSFIVCHKTLDGERAVCRGFYDRYPARTIGCRVGYLIGLVEVDA